MCAQGDNSRAGVAVAGTRHCRALATSHCRPPFTGSVILETLYATCWDVFTNLKMVNKIQTLTLKEKIQIRLLAIITKT